MTLSTTLTQNRAFQFLTRWMMELILVALCIFLAFAAPNFFTTSNLLNVLRSISMQGVIAFGVTMVIISREIDLSIGSAVAFSGCLIAVLMANGTPFFIAFPVTLAVGFALGSLIGVLRAAFSVPSFITTLALYTALQGGALMLTNGYPVTAFPDWYQFLGSGQVMNIPVPTLVLIVTFLAIHFLMNHTAFGRSVYAVGGNPEAARLCGINVNRVRLLVLALTQLLAALSGVMLSARIMSGSPTVAKGWELDIIAAVIIGGTSLYGGAGRVWGTLVGIVFIGVIVNGMTLLNVPSYTQYVVRGALILAAVLINQLHASTFSGDQRAH